MRRNSFGDGHHIHENINGPDDLAVADAANELACSYYSQENYDQAEPLFKRAVTIREKLGKPDAIVLANLARNFAGEDNYQQAEPFFRKATAFLEDISAGDLKVAAALNLEAYNYYRQNKYHTLSRC